MKKLISALFMILSFSNFANAADEGVLSNQNCIEVYRDGYINLTNEIMDFNDEYSNRFQFATLVSAISTEVSLYRAACSLTENSNVTANCVNAYKDLYKDLREKVKLGAIISGNQTKVTYSKKMQQVVEEETRTTKDESFLGKIKRGLKIGTGVITETISRSRDITMLEFIDLKCNQ